MGKKKIWMSILGIVLLLFVGFSIYKVISVSDDELKEESSSNITDSGSEGSSKAEGENLTETTFNSVYGDSQDLQQTFKDHEVTVVNIFASWCTPCRTETPELNDYFLHEKPDDVALVGLNVQDSGKARDQFLDEFDVQYPIYDMENDTDFMTDLEVLLIPTTFFVNKEGEIVKSYTGEVSQKTLDNYIDFVKGE